MGLITLEEYKDFNLLSANPKDDGKILLLIESISNLIQTYLKIDLEGGTTRTETISLDYETNKIFLEKYPLSGPINITESNRYTTDSSVHVPLTGDIDYTIDLENGIITRNITPGGFGTWPLAPGTVSVTYTTAPKWPTNTIPADLKLAAINLVNYYRNEEFKQSKTIQGASIVNTFAIEGSDFPKHIQVILDRYKDKY